MGKRSKGGKGEPEKTPAPAPAPVVGPLTDEFVEAASKHLAELPPRESERWLHRYENTQPELAEAVRLQAGDDAAVLESADTLSFELWAMLELAQPKRLRVALMDELAAALESVEAPLPALDRYLDACVAEAKSDPARRLTPEQAAKVARIARAVVRTLSRARG